MRARITLALLAVAAAVVPLAAVSAGPASPAVRPTCPGTHPVMLYVTDDFTVTPVCAATGTVLKAITTGPGPADHLVATPDGKTLYVSNGGIGETIGHTVTVISTVSNTAIKTINVGRGAGAIAITPNGKTVYVLGGMSNTVTPIRTATNTGLKPIKVGTQPWEIAISPDGKTAYVTSALGVVPIRTATNTALKAVKVSGQLQPRGHRDHPGREDRLCRRCRADPDPDGHQHGAQGNPAGWLGHHRRCYPVETGQPGSPRG